MAAMVEPADKPIAAGQRLGAPDSFGVSTLEPGLRPLAQPPAGRLASIRVQMLDDTQEVFQISVSHAWRLRRSSDIGAAPLSGCVLVIKNK